MPHALQAITGPAAASYLYDANGNATSSNGGRYSNVRYTSFNLPNSNTGVQGAAGLASYSWQYDEDHQRIKEVRMASGSSRTTWMLHPDNAGGLSFERKVIGVGFQVIMYPFAAGRCFEREASCAV
jgi:hypothetical protein